MNQVKTEAEWQARNYNSTARHVHWCFHSLEETLLKAVRLTENVLEELVTELNADLIKEDLKVRQCFQQEMKAGAKAQRWDRAGAFRKMQVVCFCQNRGCWGEWWHVTLKTLNSGLRSRIRNMRTVRRLLQQSREEKMTPTDSISFHTHQASLISQMP